LALCLLGCAQAFTSLDWYVKSYNDHYYHYNVSDTVITKDRYTVYNLYLTSQKWLTHGEVENGADVWHHWLQVCVPDNLIPNSDMAFLYINGGSTKSFNQPPGDIDTVVSKFCTSTGLIGGSLLAVPNEPITFTGEAAQKSRTEDAIIAYTWSHWINNTAEFDWLLRMPMTKAAVKAMDAMQDWSRKTNGISPIERFGVAGASKRGWTTWMVGGMDDPRVVAIAPIVAPVANLVPQINEMWQAYGNWSFALQDYVEMNLMGWLNLPRFTELLDIIDPLSYPIAIGKIPKYVVNACGDEFFMPDAAQYYWSDLPGQKDLYMVPNAEHSLAGHAMDVVGSTEQFFLASFYNKTEVLPDYLWEISADGTTITLSTNSTEYIVEAKAFYSLNNPHRDWRLITCTETDLDCLNLRLFKHEVLTPIADGMYTYTIPTPAAGHYSAFMIQVSFDFKWPALHGVRVQPFHVTSNLSIAPRDQYPYDPCPQDVCKCGYDCANNYYTD